jgi:hypothetical protein
VRSLPTKPDARRGGQASGGWYELRQATGGQDESGDNASVALFGRSPCLAEFDDCGGQMGRGVGAGALCAAYRAALLAAGRG